MNASSRMPSKVSAGQVLPATVQALRGLIAIQLWWRQHLDVGRQVELDAVAALAVRHPEIDVEEAGMLDVPDELRRVLEVDARAGRHAFARHLEEDRRLRRIAAAPPQPHRPRIARCRDVAAPGAAEQQRVGIEPAHPALGFRAARSRPSRRSGSRGRTRATPRRRCRRARDAGSRGRACRAASPHRPRSSPRLRPRPGRRHRAGSPRPAGRGESSRAWCAATGRAGSWRRARNCRATVRAARPGGACRAGRGSPPGCRGRRRTAAPPKVFSVRSFSAATQASARSPSMSSSQR